MKQAVRNFSQRFVAAAVIILPLIVLLLLPSRGAAVNVLTQHNNNFRTGANLNEYVLTTSNVNTGQFGKLFTRAVDGAIYAQPLYIHSLIISNITRNVIYVCTEHNSVYCFDADNPTASNALWQVNLGPSVSSSILNCPDLQPEVGITGTPVIDPVSGTLYVEAKTLESSIYIHRLHALDLISGAEKFNGPVVLQATVPGTGDGSNTVSFVPKLEFNRPGLLLLSNVVYIAFGSHCDIGYYHGWVFGYNASDVQQQVSVFCTTPNGNDGGIWAGGMGPAADSNGNIYVMTGNGTFDATNGTDYGDSFIKLSTAGGTLTAADSFAPHDQATLSYNDQDVGSGGPMLVPGTNILVGLDKIGRMYVVNQNHFGGFVPTADTNIVQEFQAVTGGCCVAQCPVFWSGPTNQLVFTWTASDVLKAYQFNGFTFQTTPVAKGTVQQGRPGGTSLSANGNAAGSAIVWGIEGNNNALHAYSAVNISNELWNSQQNAARDSLGTYVKFCAPTIVNGKVYAPTGAGQNQLVVYSLLGTPYQIWQHQNFSSTQLTNAAVSGDTVSPAGDGIPNLMKYAFNLNPFVPSTGGLPQGSLPTIGGTNYLALTFKQVLFATDISYTVQVSGDLITWNSGPGYTAQIGPPIDNGDGTETVTFQDIVPVTSANARFIRVQISGP
jgi:hypothetical protein